MKKLFSFIVAAGMALAFTACNKTVEAPADLQCNPNPLTVVGNKINATVSGTFETKTFSKKGVLVVTPVLKYNGKEVLGEPKTYVGQKIKENGQTIAYKVGGKYEMPVSFNYDPEMAQCELYLRFDCTVKGKPYEIPEIKVADGLQMTAKRSTADEIEGAVTPDKFQRVISEMQEADIKFLIQQASLRSEETKSESVKNLTAAVKDASKAENKEVKSLEIAGYASPDGSLDLNTRLAQQRQANTADFIKKQLKKDKVSVNIDSKTTAEDWDGFQKLMEQSNMQDKNLVLRVLSMYQDPEQRETEIKNLSSVYTTIADEILPQLRRARLQLTTDIIGKSDEEIKKLAKEDPSQLTVEELLYSATLTDDKAEKEAIYNTAIKNFPKDFRAYNNLGLLKAAEGKYDEAAALYKKALDINPNDPNVNYNAGVAAMAQGDLKAAQAYLGKAAGANANVNDAMGTLYTAQGDYKKALSTFGNTASNNAAVQLIVSEDYAAARTTLNNVKNPNATTYYLLSVVGARTNDRDAVYTNMKKAVSMNADLKAQAQKDIEFSKYAADEAFQAIVK